MAKKEIMEYDEVIDKIMAKKEFSDLPRQDVETVYSFFDKGEYLIEERVKLTRNLLRKMYTAFLSDKLFTLKDKDVDWFLKKHISTKERMDHYEEVYKKCFKNLKKELTVFDLGCGINGFSYHYFKNLGFKIKYIGTEPVGQLVKLQNDYFEKSKLNARVEKISLFELKKNLDLIKNEKGRKVLFLFKTLDSLEMIKKDYSKEVLHCLVPLVDRVIISWATRSLISRKKFFADRSWLKDFVGQEFKILDEFEIGNENYLVFSK